MKLIGLFIKERRKMLNMTQQELALKAGVGYRFIRELEAGKLSLKIDKINQVLKLFGHELGPVPIKRENLLNEKS
jgi:y4mF family transcriptional regulator